MQQQIQPIPNIDPTTLIPFAFVCDGEVAFMMRIPPQNEHFIAVLQSNPVIVQYPKNADVQMGDRYVNGEFVKP